MKIFQYFGCFAISLLLVACSSTHNLQQQTITPTQSSSKETTTPSLPSEDENEQISKTYHRYLNSQYDVSIALPSDWKMSKVKVYPNGWAKFYGPDISNNYDQRIIVHYFKDENTTPKEFLKKAKEVSKQLNCKLTQSKVKKINSQSVTFSVTNERCPTIHDIAQIYKTFSMTDGLYTITYRAKLKNISKKELQDLSVRIEQAEIIKKIN